MGFEGCAWWGGRLRGSDCGHGINSPTPSYLHPTTNLLTFIFDQSLLWKIAMGLSYASEVVQRPF